MHDDIRAKFVVYPVHNTYGPGPSFKANRTDRDFPSIEFLPHPHPTPNPIICVPLSPSLAAAHGPLDYRPNLFHGWLHETWPVGGNKMKSWGARRGPADIVHFDWAYTKTYKVNLPSWIISPSSAAFSLSAVHASAGGNWAWHNRNRNFERFYARLGACKNRKKLQKCYNKMIIALNAIFSVNLSLLIITSLQIFTLLDVVCVCSRMR